MQRSGGNQSTGTSGSFFMKRNLEASRSSSGLFHTTGTVGITNSSSSPWNSNTSPMPPWKSSSGDGLLDTPTPDRGSLLGNFGGGGLLPNPTLTSSPAGRSNSAAEELLALERIANERKQEVIELLKRRMDRGPISVPGLPQQPVPPAIQPAPLLSNVPGNLLGGGTPSFFSRSLIAGRNAPVPSLLGDYPSSIPQGGLLPFPNPGIPSMIPSYRPDKRDLRPPAKRVIENRRDRPDHPAKEKRPKFRLYHAFRAVVTNESLLELLLKFSNEIHLETLSPDCGLADASGKSKGKVDARNCSGCGRMTHVRVAKRHEQYICPNRTEIGEKFDVFAASIAFLLCERIMIVISSEEAKALGDVAKILEDDTPDKSDGDIAVVDLVETTTEKADCKDPITERSEPEVVAREMEVTPAKEISATPEKEIVEVELSDEGNEKADGGKEQEMEVGTEEKKGGQGLKSDDDKLVEKRRRANARLVTCSLCGESRRACRLTHHVVRFCKANEDACLVMEDLHNTSLRSFIEEGYLALYDQEGNEVYLKD